MASSSDTAAGVAKLAAFARTCSIALHSAISSHDSLQRRVRDLDDEAKELAEILRSLEAAAKVKAQLQNPSLETPLRRCATACQAFKQQIREFSSPPSCPQGRGSCDWASLRYLGEDIYGFREILSGYKMTMAVALTDASIEDSLVTPDAKHGYTNLVNRTRADLQGRQETMDQTMQGLRVGQSATRSKSNETQNQIEQLHQERRSIRDCLQVCTQLSDHITRLESANKTTSQNQTLGSDVDASTDNMDGLQDCKDDILRMRAELDAQEKDLFAKLMKKLNGSESLSTSAEDIARLTNELESTRRHMGILQSVSNKLEQQVSFIENYAIGDAVQFMVSTKGKLLHGKNRGLGWKTRQVGGYLDDETVKQLSRDFSSIGLTDADNGPRAQTMSGARQAEFHDRYGHGFKLTT